MRVDFTGDSVHLATYHENTHAYRKACSGAHRKRRHVTGNRSTTYYTKEGRSAFLESEYCSRHRKVLKAVFIHYARKLITAESNGSLEDHPAIMSNCNTNASTQPLQHTLAEFLVFLTPHPSAVDLSFLLLSCPILAWSLYPRSWGPPFEYREGNNMGLALIGVVVLVLCAISYALRVAMGEDDRAFQDRKDLYRKRRDAFRSDPQAMEELRQWKQKNNDFDYKKL